MGVCLARLDYLRNLTYDTLRYQFRRVGSNHSVLIIRVINIMSNCYSSTVSNVSYLQVYGAEADLDGCEWCKCTTKFQQAKNFLLIIMF